MKRRTVLAALAVAAFASAVAQAPAEWQPNRPIRVIVGLAAGGSTDVTARLLAEALSGPLGQPVIVENRPGAAGTTATEEVARSAPDGGYTLIMGNQTTHAAAPALYPNLGYDPVRAFVPISIVVLTPNTVAIHPSVPATTLQEFIAYAKAHPKQIRCATAGVGSSLHLAAALLASMAGFELTMVHLAGGSPAVADLVAGSAQLVATPLIDVLPAIRANRVRALGVSTRQRASLLPDVPAIQEIVPGYELAGWAGLFAPSGTPPAVVHRISREVIAIMQRPEMRRRVEELGSIPVSMGGDDAPRFQTRTDCSAIAG